jgi:hypothetical protein
MIGRGGRTCTGTGNHAQRVLSPPCFLISPRRDKVVRTEGIAPSWTFAHRLLGPTRLLFRHVRKSWSIHRDVRPARCLTKTVRRFLRVGCKNGRSGRTRTFAAREGGAFTARCNCCSATLRKNGGSSGIRTRDLLLMRELRCLLRHRAEWWAASVMLRVLPGKNRRLHY